MNPINEEMVDIFLDYIRYFSIAHHIPGRIRIKASLFNVAQLANVDEKHIEGVIDTFPGIHSYRINKKGLSAVVEYDKDILPPDLWDDVAGINTYPQTRDSVRERLLNILATLTQS